MFDIGFFELVFIAIIALLVLGPEKMPHAVRMTGAWVGRIRRSFLEAKYEIERQVQLEEFKQRVSEEKEHIENSFNQVTNELASHDDHDEKLTQPSTKNPT